MSARPPRRTDRWILTLFLTLALGGCAENEQAKSVPSYEESLMWAEPYPDLVIHVDYVEGRQPSAAALETMVNTLRNVTDKRTILLEPPEAIRGYEGDAARTWDPDAMEAFHDERVGEHPIAEAGRLHLHVIYLDGTKETDGEEEAWGSYFGNGEVYVFTDPMRDALAARSPPDLFPRIERSVLVHELGHALGLVGCGTPALTARKAPGCHSTNEESVMAGYVPNDLSDLLTDLAEEGRGIPYEFDEADLRDLAAVRDQGRARTSATAP